MYNVEKLIFIFNEIFLYTIQIWSSLNLDIYFRNRFIFDKIQSNDKKGTIIFCLSEFKISVFSVFFQSLKNGISPKACALITTEHSWDNSSHTFSNICNISQKNINEIEIIQFLNKPQIFLSNSTLLSIFLNKLRLNYFNICFAEKAPIILSY